MFLITNYLIYNQKFSLTKNRFNWFPHWLLILCTKIFPKPVLLVVTYPEFLVIFENGWNNRHWKIFQSENFILMHGRQKERENIPYIFYHNCHRKTGNSQSTEICLFSVYVKKSLGVVFILKLNKIVWLSIRTTIMDIIYSRFGKLYLSKIFCSVTFCINI